MSELVIEHLAHPVQDLRVTCVGEVSEGGVYKHCVQSGWMVRPIRTMQRGWIEGRMSQIGF